MLGTAAAMSPAFQVEIAVIGAGVIGLAIARSLAIAGKEVLLLDRASAICTETSSRNSEVIHAGLYYPSSSLKARFCVQGKNRLYEYCQSRQVSYNPCGKLLVATDSNQLESVLPDLQQKARHNGVEDIRLLSRDDVKHLEPDIECVGALLSPSTGVLDSHSYYLALLADAESHGVTLSLHSTVDEARVETMSSVGNDGSSRGDIRLKIEGTWVQCQAVVNSAGLSADHVARMLHKDTPSTRGNTNSPPWTPPCHYFAKGTYFRLAGKKPSFRHLIYPIPERGGLGVHATIDWSGTSIKFGPDVEWMDPSIVQSSKDIDLNPDPQRGERFYDAVRTYWPDLQDGQLVPDYVGIRPKLHHPSQLSSSEETLGFMDFSIVGSSEHGIPGLIHLFGMESPGLTSSMAIADYVRDMVLDSERR